MDVESLWTPSSLTCRKSEISEHDQELHVVVLAAILDIEHIIDDSLGGNLDT